MADGLVNYGLLKPELATSVAQGFNQGQIDQLKLEELKRDRTAMFQLQDQLKAAGKDPDLNKVFDALIATGKPDYVLKGIEGKRRLTEQTRAEGLLKQYAPELFGAPSTAAAAPTTAAPTTAAPTTAAPTAAAPTTAAPTTAAPTTAAPTTAAPTTAAPTNMFVATAPSTPVATPAVSVNAMAQPAPTVTADQLRRQIYALSSVDDPRAKAMVDVLKNQLNELTKTHVVSGRLVQGSKELYRAPTEIGTLEQEIADLRAQGISDKDFRIKARLDKITKLSTHQPAALTNVMAYTPASERAQTEFMTSSRATYDALKNAPATLANIEEAKKLIPSAKQFMGPGGESVMNAASFLNNRLGTSIDVKGITNASELRSRLFNGVIENLRKLDAQPTQAQQQVLQDAIGNLGTDPNALARVLDAYADTVRNKVNLYNEEVTSAEARGIKFPYKPQIKLPETKSSVSGSQNVTYAINKSTGERIMSTDGGVTWNPAR